MAGTERAAVPAAVAEPELARGQASAAAAADGAAQSAGAPPAAAANSGKPALPHAKAEASAAAWSLQEAVASAATTARARARPRPEAVPCAGGARLPPRPFGSPLPVPAARESLRFRRWADRRPVIAQAEPHARAHIARAGRPRCFSQARLLRVRSADNSRPSVSIMHVLHSGAIVMSQTDFASGSCPRAPGWWTAEPPDIRSIPRSA